MDLHVHSRFSDSPYSIFLRAGQSAECYTDPRDLYETAMRRGMTAVTVTDHDTIRGALELKELADNTFISEEISARFPEDGCIVHVIVLDIDEAQHADIHGLRRNIYELTAFLRTSKIAHFLCHPLAPVNGRLTADHLRQCFLMFDVVELVNGTRDRIHEACLRNVISGITPARLARWAERFPQTPFNVTDARYGVVGGSDDHGRVAIARAFTEFAGPSTGVAVADAVLQHETTPAGQHASGHVLAHNAYGVLAGYLQDTAQVASLLNDLQPRNGGTRPGRGPAAASGSNGEQMDEAGAATAGVAELFAAVAESVPWDELVSQGHTDDVQARLLAGLTSSLVDVDRAAFQQFYESLSPPVNVAGAFNAVPGILTTMFLGLPYLLAQRYHAQERLRAARLSSGLGYDPGNGRAVRVAVLTDVIDEVDGLSLGLRTFARTAREQGHWLRIVALGDGTSGWYEDDDGVIRIPRVLSHRFEFYSRYLFGVPHFNSLMGFLVSQEVDVIQASTQGPVGMAGIAAGYLTGAPVVSQFHTDVPEYVTRLTGDADLGGLVATIVGWFHRLTAQVLVPSRAAAERVKALGVSDARVEILRRGIELRRFHPGFRDTAVWGELGIASETRFLYVGRISKEKGLDRVVDGFAEYVERNGSGALVLVGDGPYLNGLKDLCAERGLGGRVSFLGEALGERLSTLYASADVFISLSDTETFGNTIVEAQASGLPVVVSAVGGAAEQVRHGETGFVLPDTGAGEVATILLRLESDAELRRRLSIGARRFAERYNQHDAVTAAFALYAGYRIPERRGDRAASAATAGEPV